MAAASSARHGGYRASIHLDAVRGIAALAVVAYHVRYNFFCAYQECVAPTVLSRLFFAATSFGHDAVVVFFVLSGYLISGSVLRDVRMGRWSWTRYLFNRVTRLYVVLVPGLVLTTFWDRLGLYLFSTHPAYTGAPQLWSHDFFPVIERSTPSILLANLGFLHAIAGIPPYGTAGPLWSLTYEFAYYLIFPAALITLWPTTPWRSRVVSGVATLLLAEHFGRGILAAFPIWLFGFGLQLLPRTRALQGRSWLWNLVAAAAMVCAIGGTHTSMVRGVAGSALIVDYINGVISAAALYVLLHDRRPARRNLYDQTAATMAGMSYTLYVVHMSLLIFVRAWLNDGPPWQPSTATFGAALAIGASIVVYAGIVGRLTESRTDRIRTFAEELLWHRRRRAEPKAVEHATA